MNHALAERAGQSLRQVEPTSGGIEGQAAQRGALLIPELGRIPYRIGEDLLPREAPSGPKAYGYRRIDVASGDVPDGVGHGQHGQTEGQCYPEQTDADLRKRRRQNRAAASPENQPERAEELCERLFLHSSISFESSFIVTSTSRDLEQEIAEGNFREDLFHRLNVVPLKVPGLSERREDIPLLVKYFVNQLSLASGLQPRRIGDDALAVLQSHDWPGNVRQLKNNVERLLILTVCRASDEYLADNRLGWQHAVTQAAIVERHIAPTKKALTLSRDKRLDGLFGLYEFKPIDSLTLTGGFRVDDQYGIGYVRDQPRRQDLKIALDELHESIGVRSDVIRASGVEGPIA